jgi:hypothetical protein
MKVIAQHLQGSLVVMFSREPRWVRRMRSFAIEMFTGTAIHLVLQ